MLETLLITQLWSSQPELFQCHEPIQASGGSETHSRNLSIPADVEFLQFKIQLYGIVDSYSVVLPGYGAVTEAYQVGGYHTETFPVPLTVKQGHTLRIQVVGNNNPGTAWNYTLSCLNPGVERDEPVARGFGNIKRVPHSSGEETMQAVLYFDSLPEGDICIVERLNLEDMQGNRIDNPPLPFEPNRDDAFVATWGTSSCPRLYSTQKPPAPGGITSPDWIGRNVYPITDLSIRAVVNLSNLGRLTDSHGTSRLCQNMGVEGRHITHQQFYWYRPNNPSQLYRLRYKSGEMVETTIERRYLPTTAEQEVIFRDHQGELLGRTKFPALACPSPFPE